MHYVIHSNIHYFAVITVITVIYICRYYYTENKLWIRIFVHHLYFYL